MSCILLNPFIVGIGVRVSIYIQAFLGTTAVIFFGLDGKISALEDAALNRIFGCTFLTAYALVITAFVQAATAELSVHHALIVLNLSWVNSTGMLLCIFVDVLSAINKRRVTRRTVINPRSVLTIIHLSTMAGLGLWVWAKVTSFGSEPECTHSTFVTLFGHDIPATNKPLRVASLFLYSIIAFPGINLLASVIIGFFVGAALFFVVICPVMIFIGLITWRLINWRPMIVNQNGIQNFVTAVILAVGMVIFFMVDTELMIQRNTRVVREQESQWSFGQTLAMLILAVPLFEVVKWAVRYWHGDVEEKVEPQAKEGQIVGVGKQEEDGEHSDSPSLAVYIKEEGHYSVIILKTREFDPTASVAAS